MFGMNRVSRSARLVVAAAALSVVGFAPMAGSVAASPGMPGCPSTADIIAGFNKGLGHLVEDGSLSRGEAKDARAQFAEWANGEAGLGCAIRDGMMDSGEKLLAFVGMTAPEMKEAYYAGQSLSEMAASNGHSEADLIDFLNDMVDGGLDAFVAAGAFDRGVRNAIDARAEDHIVWAVDYEKGDPVPGHDGEK